MRETFLHKEEFEKKREKEYQYVREVLDFGWHNTRSAGFVRKLEEKFAQVFGVKYAISNNSGTGTMHTCLVAAGIGPGDEVIVPALTMASFSFQGSKHMTSGGDGGMVITDNEEYARLVRKASVLFAKKCSQTYFALKPTTKSAMIRH